MATTFYVIASVEDSAYLAWQAKLLHYSCLTRLGVAPLLVVHGVRREPHPYWEDIVRAGGTVVGAPSFRRSPVTGRDYVPRNAAGTLLHAAELVDDPDVCFMMCDPDMLFVRPPPLVGELSGDHYDYMTYALPSVRAAARRLGIDDARLDARAASLACGVPYVIPAPLARPLAEAWLDAIDAFETHDWIDGMYAFGLAAARLELPVRLTRHMVSNAHAEQLLDASMIHYCYGDDDTWTKRRFTAPEAAERVWVPDVAGSPGSVLAEIVRQLHGAREFYAARGIAPQPAADSAWPSMQVD